MGQVRLTSEDDIDYPVLATPGTVTFKSELDACPADFSDGYSFCHIYVRCEELKSHCAPLEANPREPTRADVVKKMEKTLREEPDKFHHWNNGITLICEDFTYNSESQELEVKFESGSGVCNGGHTYFSIVTFPSKLPDNCFVHLEFIKIPDGINAVQRKQIINDIASRRNRNRALLPTTQADYLGMYDEFKDSLNDKSNCVNWHEGDSDAKTGAVKSELLIRMLAAMDPFWFNHPIISSTKGNHKKASTSSKAIHREWFDAASEKDPQKNLKHMAALTPDILELADHISLSIQKDSFAEMPGKFRATSFYKYLTASQQQLQHIEGEECGAQLPNPILIMLLGSFRSNVWLGLNDDGIADYVGFLVDPGELWDKTRHEILEKLLSAFDDANKEPLQFIKKNVPYDQQLINFEYGKNPPKLPAFFFYYPDDRWFKRKANGTHLLKCSDECYVEMVPSSGKSPDENTYVVR